MRRASKAAWCGSRQGSIWWPAASRSPRAWPWSASNQAPVYIEPLIGTVILATGGRDKEDAPALFEMGNSSTVQGLTVFYPDQKPDDIHPYAWTFHLQGGDNTVENVTLINSYNGIKIGPEPNVRHRIRSVSGCVLRRGIWLDNCSDIGRIENVQWHCHWWSSKKVGGDWDKVYKYMWKNCEGFVFARTDWEYVTNTFIFPVNIGYHFIATKNGAMNGQLCGIGADAANRCIVVDQIQPMGLLITNGQFVAFEGENPIEIVVNPTCTGSVRLQNCDFWGPAVQNVVSHSQSFVSLSNCYFSSGRQEPEKALVEADGGKLQVQGCSFATAEPSILLGKGLKHAIVTRQQRREGRDDHESDRGEGDHRQQRAGREVMQWRWILWMALVANMAGISAASNVMDYGATADGKTDDTAAIQKALDAAGKDRGGVVEMPKGLYRVEDHSRNPARRLPLWPVAGTAPCQHGTWHGYPGGGPCRERRRPRPDQSSAKLVRQGDHRLLSRPRPRRREILPVGDPGQRDAWKRHRRDAGEPLQGDRLRHAPQRTAPHSQCFRLPFEDRHLRQPDHGHRSDRERSFQSARLGPLHVQRQGHGRGLEDALSPTWNRTS